MALKYKAGDQVRIKSIDWYNENINNNSVIICGSESFTHPMSYFCGKVVTIVTIQDDCYRILEDDGDWYWTDEMIEGLVKEETNPLTYEETVEIIETMQGIGDSWECPQGYQFVDEKGNVINATKIVLEKKKKEYPKTYEECCEIVHSDPKFYVDTHLYSGILETLYKLLICRDAYWKIAGDEMGLGKPWEPDWKSDDAKYTISIIECMVTRAKSCYDSAILAFPTTEMRDAFKENFKELIKICKELL